MFQCLFNNQPSVSHMLLRFIRGSLLLSERRTHINLLEFQIEHEVSFALRSQRSSQGRKDRGHIPPSALPGYTWSKVCSTGSTGLYEEEIKQMASDHFSGALQHHWQCESYAQSMMLWRHRSYTTVSEWIAYFQPYTDIHVFQQYLSSNLAVYMYLICLASLLDECQINYYYKCLGQIR